MDKTPNKAKRRRLEDLQNIERKEQTGEEITDDDDREIIYGETLSVLGNGRSEVTPKGNGF